MKPSRIHQLRNLMGQISYLQHMCSIIFQKQAFITFLLFKNAIQLVRYLVILKQSILSDLLNGSVGSKFWDTNIAKLSPPSFLMVDFSTVLSLDRLPPLSFPLDS